MEKALMNGLSGQDRRYLAEYLLVLAYEIYRLVYREAASMRWLQPVSRRMEMIYEDLGYATSLEVAFRKPRLNEIYYLAGRCLCRLRLFQTSAWEMLGNTDGIRSEENAIASGFTLRCFEDGSGPDLPDLPSTWTHDWVRIMVESDLPTSPTVRRERHCLNANYRRNRAGAEEGIRPSSRHL